MNIKVSSTTNLDLLSFLTSHGFNVELLSEQVFKVNKNDELPVFLSHNDGVLYFEVDIGPLNSMLDSQDGGLNTFFLTQLLDMNTDILPVSFAINSTNPNDQRLVLVESRIVGDLSDEEILSVFTALELATDKIERVLTK